MESIKIEVEIPRKRIAELLCSGFEGGVGYWCRIMSYDTYETKERPKILGQQYTDLPLTGGAVICRDVEQDGETDDDFKRLVLDGAAIARGLKVMAEKFPKHFGNFMNQDDDAETGDVFIQACLFGDVVYG